MPYGNINVDTVTTSTAGGVLGAGNASIMKNRLINGDMRISQRNGTSTVATPTDGQFILDRFNCFTNGGGVYSVGQSTVAPDGFSNSMLYTVTTADSSIAATDYYLFGQPIEGYNCSDLGYGTATAKTVTVSFWVRSSITGTFGFGLRQQGGSRSYVSQYTINAINTWEQKSITIAGDTAGSIANDNLTGLLVTWDLGSGSNRNGTAGVWQAGNFWRSSSNNNFIATNGATLYVTGLQLEVGSSATGFEYRQYGQELALCQRYYYEFPASSQMPAYTSDTTTVVGTISMPVALRATPSVSLPAGNSYAWTFDGYAFSTSTSISMATTGANKSVYAISHPSFGAMVALRIRVLQSDGAYKFSAEL